MHAKIIGGLMMALVCTLSLPFAQAVSAQLAPTVSGQGAPGDHIYVMVKGAKQGTFQGELVQKGLEHKFRGLKFRYETISPRDAVTSMATGAVRHMPLTITKGYGAASPQLFQALVNNETLSEVLIDFVGVNLTGQMSLSHSIRLTNAWVADITDSTEPTTGGEVFHLQDVSFTFLKIELLDATGKTMAVLDSLARQ